MSVYKDTVYMFGKGIDMNARDRLALLDVLVRSIVGLEKEIIMMKKMYEVTLDTNTTEE